MSETMTLVDDLADVLTHMVVGWKPIIGHDLVEHPEVQRVMERYRTYKSEATYQRGFVSVDLPSLHQAAPEPEDLLDCTFGYQVASDGRVWVCVNGTTWLRFKPNGKPLDE